MDRLVEVLMLDHRITEHFDFLEEHLEGRVPFFDALPPLAKQVGTLLVLLLLLQLLLL